MLFNLLLQELRRAILNEGLVVISAYLHLTKLRMVKLGPRHNSFFAEVLVGPFIKFFHLLILLLVVFELCGECMRNACSGIKIPALYRKVDKSHYKMIKVIKQSAYRA